MIDELERIGKEAVVANWDTEENLEHLSQCRRYPCQDSNRASPEYKSRALPLVQPTRSYSSTPPYALMARWLKSRETVTFTFYLD
jgi:hypothetical protein